VNPVTWHPFAPNGWSGILTGGSIIFFTYIGFDPFRLPQRGKNPQRDLPIGIIATLVSHAAVSFCGSGFDWIVPCRV